MIFRRLFERARARSSGDTHKRENHTSRKKKKSIISLIYLETCLCSTARRDSFYEDFPDSFNKPTEHQSIDQYGFIRFGKTHNKSNLLF